MQRLRGYFGFSFVGWRSDDGDDDDDDDDDDDVWFCS